MSVRSGTTQGTESYDSGKHSTQSLPQALDLENSPSHS